MHLPLFVSTSLRCCVVLEASCECGIRDRHSWKRLESIHPGLVRSLSCVWIFVTPLDCNILGFPVHYLPKLAHWVGDAIQPSRPLSCASPLTFSLSQYQSLFPMSWLFTSGRWPKYWSFSINPSKEYSELISFRIDWFDLLAVQGTLESSPAPQFKSINSWPQWSLK